MGPYYQSDWAELWCADAREVLPLRATESFDLVVTDPPYGMEWRSGFRTESFAALANDDADDRAGIQEVLRESVRLVRQKRHLYVFGPQDVLQGLKISQTTELIWDKNNIGMGNLSAPWAAQHERISFAVSNHRHGGKVGNPALAVRLRKGSILHFTRPTGRKVRHPSEKPVGLLRELIESSSRMGEVVLDPFAGIGSTGVAAILSGRKCVLVELDETYCELATARLKAAEQLAAQGVTL